MKKLSEAEIQQHLKKLPSWKLKENKLHRQFSFSDFKTAFAFMAGSAVAAESLNHHPNWSNVYNQVSVELFTHDVDALSEKDFELAAAMEKLGQALLS